MEEFDFAKMSGAGNDFIVFDGRGGIIPEEIRRELVKKVCERRFGVGGDGVLIVEDSTKYDFKMRYYNADGGEAEMCGNGGRCISRYAYLNGIAGDKMSFETIAGVHHSEVKGENVKLEMTLPSNIKLKFGLRIDNQEITVNFANTGVPHVVLFTDNVNSINVEKLGPKIRYQREFAPAGTNANFVQVVDSNNLKIRTYERGVEAETLACGTGTVAAAVIGILDGKLKSPVAALTRGGIELKVYMKLSSGKIQELFLEGDARVVFTGKLSGEWLGGLLS